MKLVASLTTSRLQQLQKKKKEKRLHNCSCEKMNEATQTDNLPEQSVQTHAHTTTGTFRQSWLEPNFVVASKRKKTNKKSCITILFTLRKLAERTRRRALTSFFSCQRTLLSSEHSANRSTITNNVTLEMQKHTRNKWVSLTNDEDSTLKQTGLAFYLLVC